eukprot:m.434967 g.434967  ORF g.434967 m.434967 type:complete len:316 (-) comp20254_c3_seq4:76-1023(-)
MAEQASKCYNKGCNKSFTEAENVGEPCKFHPGDPVFHEGYKFWSCCEKRRFTDFTAFLDHPGCTLGLHSNVKPKPKEKEKIEPLGKGEIIQVNTAEPAGERQPIKEQLPNDKSTAPLVEKTLEVTSSLKRALEKLQLAPQQQAAAGAIEVKEGDPCHHNGCKLRYPSSAPCKYHPGTPVFHEGMKFWSCCQKKKTHDFDEFLGLAGCTEGECLWEKPTEQQLEIKPCRHDFFQTGPDAVLTIFAKKINPEQSSVKMNENTLVLSIVYEQTRKHEMNLHLAGRVIPEECTVTLFSTKMEIKLRKAAAEGWPGLTQE